MILSSRLMGTLRFMSKSEHEGAAKKEPRAGLLWPEAADRLSGTCVRPFYPLYVYARRSVAKSPTGLSHGQSRTGDCELGTAGHSERCFIEAKGHVIWRLFGFAEQ